MNKSRFLKFMKELNVDDSLFDAHAQVNSGELGTKHLDMITNAMPSYFHMNKNSNMQVINALYSGRKTYRQIPNS